MKIVKIGFVALTLMIGATSFGQQKAKLTPEQRATQKTEHMAKQLLLSTEQKAKILELNTVTAKKNEEIRNNTTLTKEQKEVAIQRTHQARKEALNTILNEEQLKKEMELEKVREAKMKERKEIKEKAKQTKTKAPASIKEGVENVEEEL